MAGKKTGKRLLTWVLVLVMALSLLPLNALAALDTGHKIDVRFTVLYVGDEFNIGYNYGTSEKTQFVCQYTTNHSDTAYNNHTIAISDIKAAADRASVNSGYQIVGWSKESNANPTVWPLNKSGTTACNKGTTIYLVAKNPNPTPTMYTYHLIHEFNYVGGTRWDITATTAAESYQLDVNNGKPTRNGYSFAGWADSANAAAAKYSGGERITLTKDNPTKTIYAVWMPFFELRYDANGGTNAPANQTRTASAPTVNKVTFTVPNQAPTKADYTFKGWADSANATEAKYRPGGTIDVQHKDSPKIVYAVWEKNDSPMPDTPVPPSYDDLKSAIWKIQVKDVSTPNCGTKNHDLIDNTSNDPFNWTKTARLDQPGKYDVTIKTAPYVAKYNSEIAKAHELNDASQTTLKLVISYKNSKWVLDDGKTEIKVKHTESTPAETPPEAPTADELEKLEMAVLVKCDVDDAQQHTEAYGLLGEYNEDYIVGAPKKDGDDWLCEISYDPDLYVAEFNTAFPNLKHVRNDEKIVPVTLIWADGSWQLKTQGSVHVTEEYTVTFNSYGGTPVPPAQEVEYGLTATKPDDPTLKGYTFAFWYLGEDEENATAYDFDTPVTGDITLTAKWNINKYTVTFNSYGGTPVPPAQEVEYGLTATKPDDPTLKGYTFAFWYLGDDEQNATAYDFNTPVTENITLTAKWNINKYTVTFNSYGGTPVPPAQEVEYGLTATKPDDPTLKGYTFAFWYLGEDEENATAYDFNTPVTENITLTAKWNINKYTVTFNSYGGTPVPPAQEVEYGLTATKPDDPTLKGYTFAFWYLGDDEQNATAYDFNTPVTENITLTAKWNINKYTVTFNSYGGTPVPPAQEVEYGLTATEPATAPTKTGYTFDGWYLGDEKYDFSDAVEQNITLYANWKKNIYTVTYTDGVDGEEVFADQTYRVPFEDTTPAFKGNPTRDGYVFDGWKPAFSDTVTGNVTYVAQWTARTDLSYTVHYYLKNTTKQVANDKMVAGQTFNADVTENAIRISGYRVYGDSVKSITIGTGTNEIIFYYTRASRPSTPSKPTLNTGDHYAYVMGYPDGMVRPNGSITRAEVSTILFRLLSDKTRDEYFTTESSFTDVKAGAWYNNSIATLEKAGVIVDTAKGGAFRPNEAITRAELAAMLAQFSDAKPVKGVKFSDVSAEHWAYEAIAIAAKMGWIEGYPDGTFRPDATITRAEMMTLVNRALERVPSDEDHLLSKRVMLTFPDCKSSDWFYIAVQEATNSHTYERAATEKNGDEQWTALRANRDWTQLEK